MSLTACGDDEGNGGGGSDKSGPETAVKDYTKLIAVGDGKACELLTERFRDEAFGGADCEQTVKESGEAIKQKVGPDAEFNDENLQITSSEVDGDKASVTLTVKQLENDYELVRERGEWKIDKIAE